MAEDKKINFQLIKNKLDLFKKMLDRIERKENRPDPAGSAGSIPYGLLQS